MYKKQLCELANKGVQSHADLTCDLLTSNKTNGQTDRQMDRRTGKARDAACMTAAQYVSK